ncbi:lycopene cyclase family protein [Streptomyces pacificus]|uniref:lycopene cyclase family protein n=1 Tax=Streptomyces pacificus TaxID=2705029 RepID=UPI0015665D7B|nr:lycopene cyclase family protein [Streptomyces pacificus]
MHIVDVVIVGAGAAGLSLARRITGGRLGGGRALSVALVDAPAGPLRPPARTWCYWEESGGEYDDLLAASWDRLRVTAPDGTAATARPHPLRYKMIRSTRFEEHARTLLHRSGCRRYEAVVDTVSDLPGGGAEVRGRDAAGAEFRLRARWAFDSRPGRPGPARTTLLQHFRGWFVHTERPHFEPGVADLMDFRTPQPARGLSFGYVLPLGPREALVEYTEFSPAVLGTAAYERALRHYTGDVLGLGPFRVTATEQGVIPMTDARFPRRTGKAVFPIGTAGGATRPSTGYTFAAAQRHTRAIADALARGRTPLVAGPHPARSRLMDAVLLRALDTGRIDGGAFFSGLFREVPSHRLLRFLDGGTRWWEDVLIGFRTPVGPMLRTVVELPAVRRHPPPPAEHRAAAR